jgi:radical SAM protein with 4Fe4S-binding SPASM domain
MSPGIDLLMIWKKITDPKPSIAKRKTRLFFSRSINLLKLLSGYFLSRIFRHPFAWGLPAFISIEPTNLCNLRCPECLTGQKGLTRPAGMTDPELFRKIIDQVADHAGYLTFYFQGEPFLHGDFFSMVRYAREKGIYTVTSTNGHFLDPGNAEKTVASGLDRIIISLDGTDQESYSSYRIGGTFGKVVEGIRALGEARKKASAKKPKIIIQFLVLRTNEHLIPEIKKLSREIGADRLELKSAQFYDYANGNPLMPVNRKHSRYIPTGATTLHQESASLQDDRETRSPVHPVTCSPVHPVTRSPGHPFTRSPVHPFTRSPGHPFTCSPVHPVTRSPVHKYRNKNPLPNHCFRMWSSCVVTWDGWVVPCCYDKDAAYRMGNLSGGTLKEIWRSGEYREFREKILRSRKDIDICTNCAEGIGITSVL